MAKIRDPLLFSKHFGIDPSEFDKAGLIDPFLNVDTQLFIDPVLLAKSATAEVSQNGYHSFRSHFTNYIRLLAISEREGDAAWRSAQKLLNLREPPQTGLGYGGSGRSGSSRPDDVREAIMRTSKEVIRLGVKDPEMISLMGFFEENVGPDTIGDFTSRVIMLNLAKVTEDFCSALKIPVVASSELQGVSLPAYHEKPIVLVPKDIVRDLPIAKDWSSVADAAFQNALIRERVNRLLGDMAKATVADKKRALRSVALSSEEAFEKFLESIKASAKDYDPNIDSLGYYKIREIFHSNPEDLVTGQTYDLTSGPAAIEQLVLETIDNFRHHVEHGNLWEELWIAGQPKKERAAQLIYYAMADAFCRANNVDVSPEANMGGGPIDFKFSKGYNARVLVEMKKSDGSVVHGYKKQLEIYKDASRTNYGIFLVLDVGKIGRKLIEIMDIQKRRISAGEPASKIIVIDASRKTSASKRQ